MQKISPSKGDLSVSSRDPRRAADNGRPRSQIVMMSHSTHPSVECIWGCSIQSVREICTSVQGKWRNRMFTSTSLSSLSTSLHHIVISRPNSCSDEEPCNHVPHSCFIVPHRCYRSRVLIISILHPLWLSPLLWSVGRVGHGVEIKLQVECFHLQNYVSGYMIRYLRFYQNS
ncbi:hypothetical protein RRG08_033199 [Elysia crispata]|uniref:Uncharacterized protein n=1 Tax=Elysia crispata TaxID=231223 RepID=A0AAE1BB42_9GAST|nr:hypothetical protein RRG08_033199 [Elysia crispata]